MTLHRQNVLVTGASSGIGSAICKRMAYGGANIAMIARRSDRLDKLAADIRREYPEAKCIPYTLDITDADAVATASENITREFGDLDILVNNAGYGKFAESTDLTLQDYERMMQVNFLAAVRCTKFALPGMIARKRGTIVNIASVSANQGFAMGSAYAASKFALKGFAESLFLEVRKHNVRIVTICPGSVATEFFDIAGYQHPNIAQALAPDDVAEAVHLAAALPQNATTSELTLRPTIPQ